MRGSGLPSPPTAMLAAADSLSHHPAVGCPSFTLYTTSSNLRTRGKELAAGRRRAAADDGGLEVVGWTTAPEGLMVVVPTEVEEGAPLVPLLLQLLKVSMFGGGGGAAARWPPPPAVC